MPYNRGIDTTKLDEILEKLRAPDRNAILNNDMRDVIGNREDANETSTIAGRIFDQWEEMHVGQMVYPLLGAGTLVTAHANAYQLGDYATIIPVNTISFGFHIHHIHILAPSANGDYELRLYTGAGVRLTIFTFSRTDKKDDVEGIDLYTPHLAANIQIRAKLASSNAAQADTARIKLWYHPHGI